MNKFDQVVNEAGVLGKIGDAIDSAGRVMNVAKQVATNPSLQPLKDLLTSSKQKLTPVNYETAKKAGTKSTEKPEIASYSQGIKKRIIGPKFIFAKNAVVFNDSGLTGLVGRVIVPNDNLLQIFKNKIISEKQYDPEAIIRTSQQNNRFWVILSPKGQLTVDNARRESQREDQQQSQQAQQSSQQAQQSTQQVGGIRGAVGGALTSLGNKLAGESYYNNIINNYHPDFLLEQTEKKIENVIPFNEVAYDTFFVWSSDYPENIGKFIILPQGKNPNQKIGQYIKLEGDLKGLAQVGNKTLYANWYFCNDFERFELEKKEKDEGPKQTTLKGTETQASDDQGEQSKPAEPSNIT